MAIIGTVKKLRKLNTVNSEDEKLLKEILEQKDEYNKDEFYIAEYLIYSDVWTLRINNQKGELSIYNSDHSSRDWMLLTNSFDEFLTRFLNYGLFDEHGLYDWVNEEKADNRC